MARQRIGARRHTASAYQHNGQTDQVGNPTYTTPADWELKLSGWPCEIITASGGEKVRGRQTTAETTHVFFGEHFGGRIIGPTMRLEANGHTYNVTAAYDPDGDSREWRVEAKIES